MSRLMLPPSVWSSQGRGSGGGLTVMGKRRVTLNSSNPISTEFFFSLSVTTGAFNELLHHWLDPRALPLFSLDCAAKPSCQPMWRGQTECETFKFIREKIHWSTEPDVNLTAAACPSSTRAHSERSTQTGDHRGAANGEITERLHVLQTLTFPSSGSSL